MTVEEMLARAAIRQCMENYNISADRARFDETIAQFTEDGVLEIPGGTRFEGRDAIKAGLSGVGSSRNEPDPSRPPINFVRHNLTTSKIDFTGPDTATGRTYFNVFTNIGPDHCGFYSDRFRKVGERWLIAERKARLDWPSPDSLMAG